MLTSRFGALERNSKWNQHVRLFQAPRALPPDEPDLVRDQHRATVFQPPHRPNMRPATRVRRDTLGKNGFGSLSLRNFVVGGDAPASSLWLALASFLAAHLLSLFFRPRREGFVDLRRRCATALFLKRFDALVRGIEFP